jgi:lactoylglutathione lyase
MKQKLMTCLLAATAAFTVTTIYAQTIMTRPTAAQHTQTEAPSLYKPSVHLNHVAVFVTDLQKATYFYTKVIGLDTIPEPFHDGKHTWLSIGPHQAMHIIQGSEAVKDYYKNNHFCFTVPSVEGFTATLRNNNIGWEDRDGAKMAITTRVDGVKQLWVKDPDGYWIEINDAKD